MTLVLNYNAKKEFQTISINNNFIPNLDFF